MFIMNCHLTKLWFLLEQEKARLLSIRFGQGTHREVWALQQSVTNFWYLQSPVVILRRWRLLVWTAANSFTCLLPNIEDYLGTIAISDVGLASPHSVVELGPLAEKLGTDLANVGGDRNSYWFQTDLDKVWRLDTTQVPATVCRWTHCLLAVSHCI